jgi:hypothetical protein
VFCYTAFGLAIRSNVHIPGLLAAEARPEPGEVPPVAITLGSLPAEASIEGRPLYLSEPDERGAASLAIRRIEGSGDYSFVYADGTRFHVREDGTAVYAVWPSALTLEDTATYLLGPVMAFVLRLHGRLSLHAGVVALEGGAVALAGGPEAGKSTLVGAFALRGTSVLSDDIAPLTARGATFVVHPTYPRVRLWADSAEGLLGAAHGLPLLTPTWEKRYLDVDERGVFEARPRPLAAVVVLEQRAPGARVERMSARDAFAAILANLHTVWMLPASPQRGVFELATRLAAAVPVFRGTAASDPRRIGELCDAIEHAVAETRGRADVRAS